MFKRLLLVGLAVGAVAALSGCVVVPAHPARHGYYEGGPSVVARTPPPRHHYHSNRRHYRYRGW